MTKLFGQLAVFAFAVGVIFSLLAVTVVQFVASVLVPAW